MPLLWLGLFLILGTWCLMPGAFLFSRRAVPGPSPTMTTSPRATCCSTTTTPPRQAGGKRARRCCRSTTSTRGRRPSATRRWRSSSAAAGACSPGHGGERRPTPRRRRARRPCAELTASPQAARRPAASRPRRPGCWRARASRPTSRTACAAPSARPCAAAWWPTRTCCSKNRMRGVTLRNLATGDERVHFDLFDHLGYPGEARELFESEVRGWGGSQPRGAPAAGRLAGREPAAQPAAQPQRDAGCARTPRRRRSARSSTRSARGR